MSRKVLVLNQDYSALTLCTVPKAFILLFLNKAELVNEVENHYLHTISSRYPMPSVIRLFSYIHLPYKGVVLTRQNIFKRDNFQCQYCTMDQDLTLDHVLPRSRGGKSSWDNLVTACKMCNSRKGDYTPEEAGMPLLNSPFKPSFVLFLREFNGAFDENWAPYLGSKMKYS
jgi:5-methylcytosine-specific restriction endonuclease McrA